MSLNILQYVKRVWNLKDIVLEKDVNKWESQIDALTTFLDRYSWKPNYTVKKGATILFPFGINAKLIATNDGITGAIEPTWSSYQDAETITDGTVVWQNVPAYVLQKVNVSIGTIIQQPWTQAPPGFVALADGPLLKRAEYPELWSFVDRFCAKVTEVEWQKRAAKNTSVGVYSLGDGSTTFRCPKMLDFARGGTLQQVGTYHTDQNKQHNHDVGTNNKTSTVSLVGTFIAGNQVGGDWGRTTGVFTRTGTGAGACAHKSDTREVIRFDGSHSHDIQISETGLNTGGSEVLVKHVIWPYYLRTLDI